MGAWSANKQEASMIIEALLAKMLFKSWIFCSKMIDFIPINEYNIYCYIICFLINKERRMVSGDSFQKYVRDLFSYNAGKVSKLSNLYSDVEDAVINWCGNESEGNICIDDQHKEFALYENIKFEAFLDNMPHETGEDRLNRFLPYIIVYQVEFDR